MLQQETIQFTIRAYEIGRKLDSGIEVLMALYLPNAEFFIAIV